MISQRKTNCQAAEREEKKKKKKDENRALLHACPCRREILLDP
jgi:hypothetical protein